MKKKCLKIILAFMLVMVITFQYPVEAKAFDFSGLTNIFNTGKKIFSNGSNFFKNLINGGNKAGQLFQNVSKFAQKYDQSGVATMFSNLAKFTQSATSKGSEMYDFIQKLPTNTLEKFGITDETIKDLGNLMNQFKGLDGKSLLNLTSISNVKKSLSTVEGLVTSLSKLVNSSGLSATDKQNALQLLNKAGDFLSDLSNVFNLSDSLKSSSEYADLKKQYDDIVNQYNDAKKNLTSDQNKKIEDVLYVYQFSRDRDPSKYSSTASSVDDIIKSANAFLQVGEDSNIIDATRLQTVSKFVSGVLLTIAIAITVISAAIMGIKFMTESVEDKAKIKESMTPWVIGILVAFGAFAIWQVTINIMSQM